MIRQYHAAGRRRGGPNPHGLGVVAAGDSFYLQDEDWFRERFRGRPVRRSPWIVEGFLNGILGAARRNPVTGHYESRYISGRSDMAIVRCLRTGRRTQVAVRVLVLHQDLDLEHAVAARADDCRSPRRVRLP